MRAPARLQPTDVRPLDRPIWAALNSRHGAFAVCSGSARMYPKDVGPFAALDPEGDQNPAGLVQLARTRLDGVSMMQADEIGSPKGLICALRTSGVQMVLQRPLDASAKAGMSLLSAADAPDMLALARRTAPGPFAARTHALGAYWGIHRDGVLIAMAGERMRLRGFTEISAVCVDAEHRGCGLARALVTHVAMRILIRGERPFLHALAENEPAIRLYQSLGFRIRSEVRIATFRAS